MSQDAEHFELTGAPPLLSLVVQWGQFRILKRLIAFQNNQAFSDIGRPRSFALARFGPLVRSVSDYARKTTPSSRQVAINWTQPFLTSAPSAPNPIRTARDR
jgi:hypothetical protein